MYNKLILATVSFASLTLAACDLAADTTPSSTQREKIAQEQLANQAAVTVGLPAIKNFTEKRQLKAIYELRDQADLVTYTYTLDMNGKRHKVCPSSSIGFGIPYATQFTNPQRMEKATAGIGSTSTVSIAPIPQSDPNALFSPPSADGTWVICLNPKTQELAPAFVEPRIVVYTFEMPSVGD